MNNQELVESLISEAGKLPLRSKPKLDALRRRAEMIIRNVFGDSSGYLDDLKEIDFSPKVASLASDGLFIEAWREGQAAVINLFTTMREELEVFGQDQAPKAESVSGSIPQHQALLSLLFQSIVSCYDLEELRTFCFNLGIRYDDLRGEGLTGKARELVLRIDRNKRIDDLITQLQADHPDSFLKMDWES
jgi:hypothetical protein